MEVLWEIYIPIKPVRWQVSARASGKIAMLYTPKKMKDAQKHYVNFLKSVYREEQIDFPIGFKMEMHLQRPKTVKRIFPSVMPDLTNLVKFVEDCVSKAGIWKDDNLVCLQINTKEYSDTKHGCTFSILKLDA